MSSARSPSWWRRRRLIVALLVQQRQRRRAEARARSSEQALRLSDERIRDLGGRLLNAQESERARIARELHDDISQQLALLEIDLELLGQTASGPGRRRWTRSWRGRTAWRAASTISLAGSIRPSCA